MSHVRWLVAALVIAPVAACGIPTEDEPQVLGTDNIPPGLLEPEGTTTTSEPPTGSTTTVTIVFTQEQRGQTVLEEVEREVATPITPEVVIEALFTSTPDDAELEDGYRNQLAEIAQVRSVAELGDGLIEVDVSEGLLDVTARGLQLAFGQIVCTAVDVPGVDEVVFAIEGERQSAITDDGTATDEPATCADYTELF
jgi:spore germination protein GerM